MALAGGHRAAVAESFQDRGAQFPRSATATAGRLDNGAGGLGQGDAASPGVRISAGAPTASGTATQTFEVASPDGSLVATVVASEGQLSWAISRNGKSIVEESPLSIRSGVPHAVTGTTRLSNDDTWSPTWGQFSSVRDHHNRMTLDVEVDGSSFDLVFQVYDDGAGFRFTDGEQDSLSGSTVEFDVRYNLDEGHMMHWPNGENSPLGPHAADSLPSDPRTPIVVDAGQDGYFALLESDLYSAGTFDAIEFTRVTGSPAVEATSRSRILPAGPFATPWRVVLVGDTPGQLLESTVALNLAAPLSLKDAYWVEPGKALFNWRTLGYQAEDGFTYGVDTPTLKRLIDFAAANGIEYVQVDDTWFELIYKGGLLKQAEGFDIEEVAEHAATNGVDLVIYVDRRPEHRIVKTTDEEIFELFSGLGAVGVKYGFRGNDAPFTRSAVSGTAERRMVINFHDNPAPMTGIRRTMPNAITRQAGWGQQDGRKAFEPTDFLEMAMINALLGPFDQVNGVYDIDDMPGRTKGSRNPINSTVAGENARALIMFSGMIILPDVPEEYDKKAEMFEFLREMPATWDETRVPHSSLPHYITTARRSGQAWFVCSATNEDARTLDIGLDFLDGGTTYAVTYYEDDHDSQDPTHYIDNRETYRVRTGTVTSADTVEAVMAAGGGHCMWIRPASLPTIEGTPQVGETLTVDISAIEAPEGATFSYQWLVSDGAATTAIPDATGPGHTVSAVHEGKTISVRVKFTDGAGSQGTLTSEATGPVENTLTWHAAMTVGTNGEWAGFSQYGTPPPGSLSNQKLKQGNTTQYVYYVITNGTELYLGLNERLPAPFTLLVDSRKFASADSEGGAADVAFWHRWAYHEPKWTDGRQVEVGLKLISNNPATGAPTISGTAQVGKSLTSSTDGIVDADGLIGVSYSHQWSADKTEIGGATGSAYRLTSSEEGKTITVTVSFEDDAGNPESLTSAATTAVEAPPPLTVSITTAAPATHDGSAEFTFDIRFSEEPKSDFSYETLRYDSFTVTGGEVRKVQRLQKDPKSNIPWRVTVEPSGDVDVTVFLPATTDCGAPGAICTDDGRKLSNSLSFTVSGPP